MSATGPRESRRAAIWAALLRLKTATADQLAAEAKAPGSTVRTYLKGLEAGGYVCRKPDPAGVCKAAYALSSQAPVVAPSVRPDGTARSHGDQQDRMWRSMKMLRGFTAQDLAILSSLPARPVSEGKAKQYVHYLFAAGYLALQQAGKAGRGGRAGIYRLVASRNSGPQAPRVQKKGTEVYDPNLGKVVWRKPVKPARPGKAVAHAA